MAGPPTRLTLGKLNTKIDTLLFALLRFFLNFFLDDVP